MQTQSPFTLNEGVKAAMRGYLKELCFRQDITDYPFLKQFAIKAYASGYPPFAEAVGKAQKIYNLHKRRDEVIARNEALQTAPLPDNFAGNLVRKVAFGEQVLLSKILPPPEEILTSLYKKCGISENTL